VDPGRAGGGVQVGEVGCGVGDVAPGGGAARVAL
jgi:hypothetical protein